MRASQSLKRMFFLAPPFQGITWVPGRAQAVLPVTMMVAYGFTLLIVNRQVLAIILEK